MTDVKIDEKTLATVVAMKKAGATYKAIAEKVFGKASMMPKVHMYLTAAGLVQSREGGASPGATEAQVERMVELYLEGATWARMQVETGFSQACIRKHLRKAGVSFDRK